MSFQATRQKKVNLSKLLPQLDSRDLQTLLIIRILALGLSGQPEFADDHFG
jgi:hypothetical protein